MVAVNSAIQVDLAGQACAESIGTHLYSGVGGQMDFMRGAALSERGRPIIALPTTAYIPHNVEPDDRDMLSLINSLTSHIVPFLSYGAAVTTSRAHVHYVATEYGVAELHGRSLPECARSLIDIAAPQCREGLDTNLRS